MAHPTSAPLEANNPERARALKAKIRDRLRELRRRLVHEYETATAEEVHESARLVVDNSVAFYNAYREWIKRGFQPDRH
jgi:hypothetical protein